MRIKSVKKIVLDAPKQYYDIIEAQPYNNFLIKTNSEYIISHNCNFTDEVNFGSMTSDVEKIKAKQKHLISQVDARMQSRFMKGTYLPTLNIIASSKSSDQSFLDTYIEMKKKNESKTTLIIDEPQWVIRTDKDSKEKFYVAVGDKFKASEILPKDAPESVLKEYRAKGYSLLQVPIGYYETFNDNVELALTDIAGISTTSALKFISGARLNEIKVESYKNPFNRDIIEVGTGDDLQYSNFFDLSEVSIKDKGKPLYIHLDMSKTGDKTGIAGVWIDGKRPSSDGEASKEVYYKAAFSVSIKAPKGHEISFEKNRNFIRWLKRQGFNVKSVSCDTYQSAQIQQQLRSDGFEVKTLSVDRLENVPGTNQKVCLPYAYLKNTINEKRLALYDKCDLLTDEIINLEKEPDGHINHPDNGTKGCFTGDTKISLVDGRELSLIELVDEFNNGKQNYVYSFNEKTKRIEPKLIEKAWCTLRDTSLVEVTLDNGEKLRCTPNHRFMLRDGIYCEAQNLKTGDSLMPLYQAVVSREICIVSVKFLDYTEDVYDLTVQDNHNFALTAGVFVHNSKDQADALCGSIYLASLNIDDYVYNYGEDVTSIIDNNPVSGETIRQQVSVAFEKELQDMFTPNSVKENFTGDQNNFVDFGNGKAAPYTGSIYSNNGILIW